MTSDPERATAFYCDLLGLTAEESDPESFAGYFTLSKDGQMVGGLMRNDGTTGAPDGWSVYLSTDDAKATADAAGASGGQVIMPATEVPEQGSMALVADPGGAFVGIWQSYGNPGIQAVGEPGTPNWFELLTRDYAPTVKFYEDVFKWETDVQGDTDEFRYTTLGRDYAAAAGIMDASSFLPEGVPAHWSVYWGVEDADAASTRAEELGGTVVRPAEDSPYGRMATLADPTGALFKILQPPQR